MAQRLSNLPFNYNQNYNNTNNLNRFQSNERNCEYNPNSSMFQTNLGPINNTNQDYIITESACSNILGNIYKEINLIRKTYKDEKKINVHFNSNIRNSNEEAYKFKLKLNHLDLKNVIKCDLLKASVPKTRLILTSNDSYNGSHILNTVLTGSDGVISGAEQSVTIQNGNYTFTQLQTQLRTITNLDESVISVEYDTTLPSGGKIHRSGISYLSNHSSSQNIVIKNITAKLAYILGFCKYNDNNQFKQIYGFVNNSSTNLSIRITYSDGSTEDTSNFNANTAFGNQNDFLNILQGTNFKFGYDHIKHKYFLRNNNSLSITDITLTDDNSILSNIIGFNNSSNLNVNQNESYYSPEVKYKIETDSLTPNNGTHNAGETYEYALISKYQIKFIDTHYVYINIPELGSNQPLSLMTRDGNLNVLQCIDLDENYQGISYYRANENDLINNKFNPVNLKDITIEIKDDLGNYYNLETDWTGTLQFTIMEEHEFSNNILN